MAAPILVIVHQENSSPGRIGRQLAELGYRLDIRCPRFGDPLPKTLQDHAGAIILGGPMSVNDSDLYLRREIDWISVPLREARPFLGICLGGQMLAKHLGEKVGPHDQNAVEVGYYPIYPTEHAAALAQSCGADLPGHVYHWHGEGFHLPQGARLLARGDDFPHQAFQFGDSAFALQFHPEVTYTMMCRWTARGGGRLEGLRAKPPQQHLADWFLYDAAVAHWSRGFLRHWLQAGVQAHKAAGATAPEAAQHLAHALSL